MSNIVNIVLGIIMVILSTMAVIIYYHTFKELLTMGDDIVIIVGTFLGYIMVKLLIWGISALVMLIRD